MTSDPRTAILDAAASLGFAAARIASADPLRLDAARLTQWLAEGRHGSMAYLAEPQTRAEPATLMAGARSVVVVALQYDADAGEAANDPRLGSIARYARGADYHWVLKEKLGALAERCADVVGAPVAARACVDTAPLLERALAARAGLGFVGKNGLLIRPGCGSYFLLGELLLDVELAPDPQLDRDCGECRACLDACPTRAFVAPYVLDATRCISYLTIELRGAIPRSLRPQLGRAVVGCDVCQEVCPHNSKPRPSAPELAADLSVPALVDLLALGSAAHKRLVAGRALDRLSRNQLARNAAVALGNLGDPSAVEALSHALAEHPSALVRGHAAWALGEIGTRSARAALAAAASQTDQTVQGEVAAAQARFSILAIKPDK